MPGSPPQSVHAQSRVVGKHRKSGVLCNGIGFYRGILQKCFAVFFGVAHDVFFVKTHNIEFSFQYVGYFPDFVFVVAGNK